MHFESLHVVVVKSQIPQCISSGFLTTYMVLLGHPYVFLGTAIEQNSSVK